ncbi:MAG: phosphoglycerate kinase [Nitrospira sp.]
MKYIDELTKEELKGKIVLLRLDLNVPVADGEVTDTYRMERSIETIDFLRGMEARIIIIAHCEGKQPLEASDGRMTESSSLVPMWHYLNGYLPVEFCTSYFTPEALDKILKLEDKGVLLFENVRMNAGEKENDPEFAKKLSQMADIYVNDAFSVCHRKHASVVGVPEFLPHYGGLLLRAEIEHLSRVFNPEHPFVFILGGAKFSTKLPLIEKYLDKADTVFVGGALANDVFKERGYEVGTSLVSKEEVNMKDIINNPKFRTFSDVTVTEGDKVSFKKPDEVSSGECIVDCGPETIDDLKKIISSAKTVVWNGPLGNYEIGFKDKTEQLAEIIAQLTSEAKLESIIGGGDTVASINTLGLEHKLTFISTGGGAMLDYLVNETLPGIEALE